MTATTTLVVVATGGLDIGTSRDADVESRTDVTQG
jgi:hypothetical protein